MLLVVGRAGRGDSSFLARRIDVPERIISGVGVLVPTLRIAHMGIVEECIGGHETAHRGGVEAGAEVIEAGLGVAFFAGEHEGDVYASGVGGATGGNGPLAAEGVVIGATAIGVAIAIDEARVAEGVGEEMVHPIVGFPAGQKHAVEIVVLIRIVASAIGLFKNLRAGAIPVEIVGLSGRTGGGFADAFAVAVVEVGHAAGGGEVVFGVEDVGAADGAGLDQVSRGVVDVVGIRVLELVFGGGDHAPIFLGAASIRRGNGADAGEIAPGIVGFRRVQDRAGRRGAQTETSRSGVFAAR